MLQQYDVSPSAEGVGRIAAAVRRKLKALRGLRRTIVAVRRKPMSQACVVLLQ